MKLSENDQLKVKSNIPDGIHYVTCTHDCPDACNIELTVKDEMIVEISGDPHHEVTRGHLCGKIPFEIVKSLNNRERLKYPMLKTAYGWKRISWDEAYDLICSKIKDYTKQYGPLSILHYHGMGSFGGLKRTFTRRFFSLIGASIISGSICDSAAIEAQTLDFGEQRTHAPQDMLNSKFAIVWGKNPANANPHFMEFLKDLRKKDVEIVLIDPIKTRTAAACSEHIQINPGTDKYLALAMAKIIIQESLADQDFIKKYTVGFDEFRKMAMSVDIESAASYCGISVENIRSLALRYAKNKPSSIWLGFGLQRYIDGGETFRIIDTLGAITGNIGKPGGGVSHQNAEVQKYFDYSLNLENSSTKRRFLRKTAIAEDLEKATEPPVKMIFVTCVNPVAQAPNSLRVKKAFEKTEFVVVIDAFMTDTAECADIVLPTTRLLEEDDVTWAYSHHFIGLTRQMIQPPGEAKSDFEIFQTLAQRLGFGEEMSGSMKEWIDKTLGPVAAHGINYDSLSKGQVVNPNLDPVAFRDLKFITPSGKFNFIRKADLKPAAVDKNYPYTFLTVHHHLWLNSNIYNEKQKAEMGVPPFAYIHPSLADSLGLSEGNTVVLSSRVGVMEGQIKISDKYPPNAVAMYQGGRVSDKTCANIITDDGLISDYGDMGAYYSTRINVEPITEKIVLDHGTGAKLSNELVSLIADTLGDVYVGEMEDSAILLVNSSKIAVTTDSFVVTPIFFGNGDIGKIAVCGTVNDISVSGAKPLYLTLAMVLEAGFPVADLLKIIKSIRDAALEANVKIVAGDTKVVNKGEIDKIFLNTTGVGIFERPPLSFKAVAPGDKIIISGYIGNHSIHLLSVREGLGFEQRIKSDCAPLNRMIDEVLSGVAAGSVKAIRDVTRGGLSAVLHEFAKATGFSMFFEEEKLPILHETAMAADMLGINPIHLANEGCICLFVKPAEEEKVLSILRNNKYGKEARTIGYVSDIKSVQVIMSQPDGSEKILEELMGAELPRLC
jgi:hydrogenase expression/formation protein HypE